MIKTNIHKVNRDGSLCFITFKNFDKHPEIRHAFTTRHGGVSEGYFGKMNLSFTTGDNRETVQQNYIIICNALGIDPHNTVLSRQTHTSNVKIVGTENVGTGVFRDFDYTDVDALVTNEKGVALVTHSADCCILAFYDPKKQVIAAAHAGWRGTATEIGGKTVRTMVENYGCNPKDIIAAVAPSIGPCCYEVDMPVYTEFAKLNYLDMPQVFKDKQNGKFMLNLWEANRQILMHYGILKENIEVTDICTNCNSEHFHSHRATAGRRGVNGLILELAGD